MNPDYDRRFACCHHLVKVFQKIADESDGIHKAIDADFGPPSKTPTELGTLVANLLDSTRDKLKIKGDHTSPRDCEESPEILEALRILESLLTQLDEARRILSSGPESGAAETDAKRTLDEVNPLMERISRTAKQELRRLEAFRDALVGNFSNLRKPEPPCVTCEKCVVSVDLAKYGYLSLTRTPEELFRFNADIRQAITDSIGAVGVRQEDVIVINTGDGAILLFDQLEKGIEFAEKLLLRAAQLSEMIPHPEFKRHFRAGVAKGLVALSTFEVPSFRTRAAHVAGTAIALAVRLQSQASVGSVVIMKSTSAELSDQRLLQAFLRGFDVPLGLKEHEKILESQLGTAIGWQVVSP